jgi:glycosyltransferase involved in cell wall biosynthesis
MNAPSATHLVLIPSFNTGLKVVETVQQARQHWNPVWVVVDGSTDGTERPLLELARDDPGLRVFVLPHNCGKGAAILYGLRQALNHGFTHVLAMDSDGQHPPAKISEFMQASRDAPDMMILGKPVFDATAPRIRVWGRKISNLWTNVETLWVGIGDSLFGFRVYPARALFDIMSASRWMRRFDFDAEAVVRLAWAGTAVRNIDTPVRYFRESEGGVSHFNYLRDNVLLTWMHTRLVFGFAARLPLLIWCRLGGSR